MNYPKILTLLMVLMLVTPTVAAVDFAPRITYFTYLYMDGTSTAMFFGNAYDFGDNSGLKNIKLYEVIRNQNGDVVTQVHLDTQSCNQNWDDCDYDGEVTKETAGTYEFFMRVKDNGGHEKDSDSLLVAFEGTNSEPRINSYSPSSRDVAITEEEDMTFTATAVDDDDDELTFRWYLRLQDGPVQEDVGSSSSFTFDFELYNDSTSTLEADLQDLIDDGEVDEDLIASLPVSQQGLSSEPLSAEATPIDTAETEFNGDTASERSRITIVTTDTEENTDEDEAPAQESQDDTNTDDSRITFYTPRTKISSFITSPVEEVLGLVETKNTVFNDGTEETHAESRITLYSRISLYPTGSSTSALTLGNNSELYTIYLTVTDGNGGIDVFYWNLTVSDSVPIADFTFTTPVYALQAINFTELSSAYDGVVAWSWDFNGDGVEDSALQNPSFTYTTLANFPVTLTVTDGDGSSASVTQSIDITEFADINDPVVSGLTATPDPAVLPGVFTTGDTNVSISATVTDNQLNDRGIDAVTVLVTEPDGTETTFAMTSSVVDVYDVVFDIAQVGTHTIDLTATDNFGRITTDAATFVVDVAPVFGTSTTTITDPASDSQLENGTAFDVNVTIDASSDPLAGCNATLSFSDGTVLDTATPVQTIGNVAANQSIDLTWSVDAINLGSSDVDVTLSCAQGYGSEDTITNVTIVPVDLAPVFLALTDTTVTKNATLVVNATADDNDTYNETITYSTDATFGSLDANGMFTHDFGQMGTMELVDLDAVNDIVTFIDQTNGGTRTATYDNTTGDGELIAFGYGHNFTVDETLGTVDMNGATLIVGDSVNVYQFDILAGTYPVEFNASDGTTTTSQTITITILDGALVTNTAPVLAAIGDQNTTENVTLTIQLNATDAENDALTFGTNASFGSIDSVTGLFNWTPSFTDAGNYSVEFSVTDGFNLPVTETITIVVNESGINNNPPVFDPMNTSFSLQESDTLSLDLNATDSDGDNLTYSTNATFGTFDNATGEFNWTTTNLDVGNHTIQFGVSDGNNPEVTLNMDIEVTAIPDLPPVLSPIGNQTTAENVTLTIQLNATDPENDTLTFGTNASFGSIDSATGLFNWTPSFVDAGNYSVEFNVSDGNNPAVTETINIEVIDVPGVTNVPPVFNMTTNYTAVEGSAFNLTLNATDADGDNLTYSANATFGSLNTTSGEFTWTPTLADVGNHTVEFGVSDGTNPEAFITVDIEVLPSNFPPVLDPIGNQTVNENQTLTIQLNASDPENDTLTYFTDATFGSLNATTGLFTWTTNFTDAGNHTVEFGVSDGTVNDTESITITVINVNLLPTAQITNAAPTSGIVPLTVQFNGTGTGGDGVLTYSWDFNNDGNEDAATQDAQFTFNTAGTYNANLTVTDEDGDSDTATVIITVQPEVHDVTVDTLTYNTSAINTYLDDTVLVSSQITNNGNVADDMTVVLEVNGVVVDTENATLAAGASTTVDLDWAATLFGTNAVVVRAIPLMGETDMTDNVLATAVDVWSVETIISGATREVFVDPSAVAVAGTVTVYLPLHNDYDDLSFQDIPVTLSYNSSAFTLVGSQTQLIDFSNGELVVVSWTLTADVAGNYTFSVSIGNNEITDTEITGKTVAVA